VCTDTLAVSRRRLQFLIALCHQSHGSSSFCPRGLPPTASLNFSRIEPTALWPAGPHELNRADRNCCVTMLHTAFVSLNPSQPSGHYLYRQFGGHYIYRQFKIQQFYVQHTVCLCVLCGSENKQRLFHCTALTGWFL
jgi:hypothetical protein